MNKLVDKLLITGELEVLTGLHIGASKEFSSIGGVDSVVIRDPITKQPIIPGSSLKGKLRTLLAKFESGQSPLKEHHEDSVVIKRLFGHSPRKDKGALKDDMPIESRLQFYDLFLTEDSAKELGKKELDLPFTEVKFENSIDRKTAEATPRQLERVPKGAKFQFKLVYNVEKEEEVREDFEKLEEAFKLLKLDYLGGSGTRGYGRVAFKDIDVNSKLGKLAHVPTLQI